MQDKKSIGIIPARFASTRLPGKPLANILGKPLIYYVWKAATDAKLLSKVIVATDDINIQNACKQFGADCMLTPPEIKSGSDRTIFALKQLNEYYDYIVNIQGDEPFITGELIDKLIDKTISSKTDVGTVITRIKNESEVFDESVVKVVVRNNGTALYFSRSPIPYVRDSEKTDWLDKTKFFKHIGIYCYTREALLKFCSLPQSDLELTEKLEQLRLLEDGAQFACLETELELKGVDTPADLEAARELMKKRLS